MMVTGTIADNAIVGSRLAGLASPGSSPSGTRARRDVLHSAISHHEGPKL
jgi:hypothetical protein